MITGLIMAAGMGRRFGGDKMLHPIENPSGPALAMGLQSALNLRPWVDEVICVLRPQDQRLKQLFIQHGFKTQVNPHHQQGLSSSLVTGIEAAPHADMWLIALGDMPFIQPASYRQLKQVLDAGDKQQIVRLSHQQRPGHPVVFPQRLKGQLLALRGDEGASTVVKQEQPRLIEVNDAGIHRDIDRPGD